MTIPVIAPVQLNTIDIRNDGFSWAHISATSSHDIQAIHRDLTYLAYPTESGTMYVSMPHPSGMAHFVHHSPDREYGFGGSTVELAMYDGPKVRLKGPWSSRAGVVNQITGRKLVELAINNLAVSIEADVLQKQLHEVNPAWTLETETDHQGEISYHLPASLAPPRR